MRYGYEGEGKLKGVLTIGAAIIVLGIGGYHLIGSTAGKINSNRDLIDTEKSFNMAIEQTPNTVSVVKIRNYTDYQGDTVEFETDDGLRVLTSIVNTSLINEDKYQDGFNYATQLANGKSNRVISYDSLQDNGLELSEGWNKRLANFDYNFDKAVEMTDDGSLIVYNVASWKDWETDDKVQITTTDGRVLLTHFRNVRLIDTSKAEKGAFENYLFSLVGDQDLIQQYKNTSKSNENNKKLMKKML